MQPVQCVATIITGLGSKHQITTFIHTGVGVALEGWDLGGSCPHLTSAVNRRGQCARLRGGGSRTWWEAGEMRRRAASIVF